MKGYTKPKLRTSLRRVALATGSMMLFASAAYIFYYFNAGFVKELVADEQPVVASDEYKVNENLVSFEVEQFRLRAANDPVVLGRARSMQVKEINITQ